MSSKVTEYEIASIIKERVDNFELSVDAGSKHSKHRMGIVIENPILSHNQKKIILMDGIENLKKRGFNYGINYKIRKN